MREKVLKRFDVEVVEVNVTASKIEIVVAHLFSVGRVTEGFYDTAINEANDARTKRNCTKAMARCQRAKVCRRPSVKTMLCEPMKRVGCLHPNTPASNPVGNPR